MLANVSISIIISTYNRSFILPRTLTSIRVQTFKHLETVIIDDGSTDNTEKAVQPFLNYNVRYIRRAHMGTPRAWNLGVRESKHDYVLFLPDDAYLPPSCVQDLVKALQQVENKNLGAMGPRLIYTNDIANPVDPKADAKLAHLDQWTGDVIGSFNVDTGRIVKASILHGCALTSKKAFLKIGGFDESAYSRNFYREETDLWLRMRASGYSLYYVPNVKIYVQKGLTKGGQLENVKRDFLINELYIIRNQKVFLRKFYRRRAYLMLPPFILRRIYLAFKQFAIRLIS